MKLTWETRRVSDDVGTTAEPARVETVAVAIDELGCEWIVAPHDGGLDGTWNWTRTTQGGELLELGTDFASADEAREAAEKRAVELL